MSQKDPRPGQEKPTAGSQPVYGTRKAAFGTEPPGSPVHSTIRTSDPASVRDLSRPQVPVRPVFGTQFAPPVAQAVGPDDDSSDHRRLPSYTSLRAVTQTQRAVGSQLSLLAVLAKAQQNNLASEPATVTESRQTLRLRPGLSIQSPAPEHRPAGKSTWDLRIHRRDVQGHISGIINTIPDDAAGTTGLQSALATSDSAPEYEVLGQLGAGNMGIVYSARQLSLNRELAIKTLKPETNHAEHDQAMFVSEAVVTANLVHPNIVPIHDLGRTADGKLFYSMKKVTGVSWDRLIRVRSLEDNLDVFMKLCDAVAYAHSRGVINRDLKPENVVVGNYGEVVVLDWGLAITNERFEKRNSVIVDFRGGAGTPVYMPPELIDENINAIGPHSDIYLLGAILFEVLEGFAPHLLRQLWDLTDPQDQLNGVIWAVIHNEIEPDVMHDGELMQIALKALSTEPEDRFPSVEALQDAIREYRITGRAEELMQSVDPNSASDYAEFQSAVALYSEALRKWPDNRRAVEGDRRARLAYAQLALKKGDIDLGLQVVARQTGESFQSVASKLKRSRLIRKIVRGTWGVMTVAAVTMLFVSIVFGMQAANERDKAVVSERDAIKSKQVADTEKEKVIKLHGDVSQLELKAAAEKQLADEAIVKADAEQKRAAEETLKANLASAEALTAKMDAEREKEAAEEATKKANAAAAEAEQAKKDKIAATEQLDAVREEAKKVEQEKFGYELEGFISLIDASMELGKHNEVIMIAKKAIAKADSNPLIRNKKQLLEDKIKNAVNEGGNAEIPLDHKPDSADISADGSTAVVYSRGAQPRMAVLRNAAGVGSEWHAVPQVLTPPKGTVRDIAVSNDGHCLCVVGKSVKQLWQLQGDEYVPVSLGPYFPDSRTLADNRTFGHVLFSRNGQHLFLIGADEKATVEIYAIGNGTAKLLQTQPLAGQATSGFEIRDIVLLPDLSPASPPAALIAQTETQECFAFRMSWRDDGTPAFGALSVTAPRLAAFEVTGQPLPDNKPDRLFLSGDGLQLAMAFKETVVVLPRMNGAAANEFPFAVQDSVPVSTVFRCSFEVTDLTFSSDGMRIATGHAKRYIQLWDRRDNAWIPCETTGLFAHKPNKGDQNITLAASLRGHSQAIKSVVFPNGDADRLVSVSADSSVRTWKISSYGELVSRMNEVCQMLKSDEQMPPVVPMARRELGDSLRSSKGLGNPVLTVAPLTQPPASSAPRRMQQGRGVFSARFSPDANRVLIGADDLAAHVFDSRTGQRVLTASMSGRKDLFFDPDRNKFLEGHFSEIASLRFLPPSGELLLSGDYFGSISVWDAAVDDNGVGHERSRLLSEYSFSEFAVSDDGTLILAGGASTTNPTGSLEDADLKHMGVLWRTSDMIQSPSPEPFLILEGQHPKFAITAVAISPSAARVVTAGRRGRIVVWNATDGNVIASILESHNNDQVAGIFFESETELVSVGYDGRILRWSISDDTLTSQEIERVDAQAVPEFIVRLRPAPDRQRFITSEVSVKPDQRGKKVGLLNLMIWSPEGARPLLNTPLTIPESDREKAFRHDISWSSDGSELMLVADGVITVFETANWTVTRKFRQDVLGVRAVRGALAPSPDGKSSHAATFDGRFTHLWDLTTGTHLAEFRSHAQYNVAADASPDQKFVATASETLRVFDADESSPDFGSTVFRLPVREPHQSPLTDVAFSPVAGAEELATIDSRGSLELWHWRPEQKPSLTPVFDAASTETMAPAWAEDLQSGNAIVWSPDGKTLAALQLGMLTLWRLNGELPIRQEVPLPEGLQCRFNQFDFSVSDDLLIAGGVAWNSATDELRSFAAVWNVSGDLPPRLRATINNQHSVDTLTKSGRTGITAIAFDDVRSEIITGGADNRLIRWRMSAMEEATVPALDRIADLLVEGTDAHKTPVTAVDVAADGRIVTADDSGYFFLWPPRDR